MHLYNLRCRNDSTAYIPPAIQKVYLKTNIHFSTLRRQTNYIHTMEAIGKLIKQELERQERTVTWFARKLSCHRTNVYDIFGRENIDMTLLVRISRILQHNFLKDLAEMIDDEILTKKE